MVDGLAEKAAHQHFKQMIFELEIDEKVDGAAAVRVFGEFPFVIQMLQGTLDILDADFIRRVEGHF